MMLLPILPMDLASSSAPLPERATRAMREGRTARRPEGTSTGRGWASSLLASPPPSPPSPSTKRRREDEDSEQKLLAAFALNQTYDVANNLGQTQYRLGKYRDAAEHLAYAVQHWPLIGKKDARDLAVKRLDEVKKQVGALSISLDTQGAELSVDGAPVGRSPLEGPLFVEPGPHLVIAKLAGYDEARADVKAQKGEEQEVKLSLVKRPSGPAAGANGTSNRGSAGGGGNSGSGPGEGDKGQPAGAGANKAVLIAGSATAGVALVSGVVFTLLANGKAADANLRLQALEPSGSKACVTAAADCKLIDSDWRARDMFSNVALFSYIGAGVLAAGTAAYGLTQRRRAPSDSSAHVEALPIVARTGSGIVIRGTW